MAAPRVGFLDSSGMKAAKCLIFRVGMILASSRNMIRCLVSFIFLAMVVIEASADVPDAGTLILLGIGLVALAFTGRREVV